MFLMMSYRDTTGRSKQFKVVKPTGQLFFLVTSLTAWYGLVGECINLYLIHAALIVMCPYKVVPLRAAHTRTG